MAKLPDFDVFVTSKPADPEANAFWTKIGGAWNHSDGKGVNIVLQALPLGGNLILRVPKPKEI